jgi:hypothetical protein
MHEPRGSLRAPFGPCSGHVSGGGPLHLRTHRQRVRVENFVSTSLAFAGAANVECRYRLAKWMCLLVASSPDAFVVSAQVSPLNRSSVPPMHFVSKRCVTV